MFNLHTKIKVPTSTRSKYRMEFQKRVMRPRLLTLGVYYLRLQLAIFNMCNKFDEISLVSNALRKTQIFV